MDTVAVFLFAVCVVLTISSGTLGQLGPPVSRDCDDIKAMSQDKAQTGIYWIIPQGTKPFQVSCDMSTSGGGWTVIQHRESNSSFNKDWKAYQRGFGSPYSNHWLGLEQIYHISRGGWYELRVDMTHTNGTARYASYQVFQLGDLKSKYELTVDGYSGNAGDSLSYHNGKPFSTYDRDSDALSTNCAATYMSGWWYKSCHQANLNGDYGNDEHGMGINWITFSTYTKSLASAEMKIRRMPTPEYWGGIGGGSGGFGGG